MMATTNGTLKDCKVEFSSGSAACVIMASKGYPEAYENGFEIVIPEEIADSVFVAGAKLSDGKLLSAGGRVLGVTAVEETLEKASASSYEKVSKIKFDNAHYRRDIGERAMQALK